MYSLTMTAHIQHLVLYVGPTFSVELGDLVLEELPLGLFVVWSGLGICVVSTIY